MPNMHKYNFVIEQIPGKLMGTIELKDENNNVVGKGLIDKNDPDQEKVIWDLIYELVKKDSKVLNMVFNYYDVGLIGDGKNYI